MCASNGTKYLHIALTDPVVHSVEQTMAQTPSFSDLVDPLALLSEDPVLRP